MCLQDLFLYMPNILLTPYEPLGFSYSTNNNKLITHWTFDLLIWLKINNNVQKIHIDNITINS